MIDQYKLNSSDLSVEEKLRAIQTFFNKTRILIPWTILYQRHYGRIIFWMRWVEIYHISILVGYLIWMV